MEKTNVEASPSRRIITTVEEVRLLTEKHEGQNFAADTETSGLNYRQDELLGIALYFETGDAYYIVLSHTEQRWDETLFRRYYMSAKEVQPYLEKLFTADVLMILHNAKFDMHFLGRVGIHIGGRLADTLLAAQLLDENRKNDLKSLAADILGMEYAKYQTLSSYKGFKRSEILGVPLPQVAEYAMNDVEATYKLYLLFRRQLADEKFRDQSLQDIYNNLWMPLLVILQKMEAKGIALNLTYVQEMYESYTKRADELEIRVREVGARMLIENYLPENIPALYLKMATPEEVEQMYEDPSGLRVIEKDGVILPVITYEMAGKTKRWTPRVVTFNTGSPKQIAELVFEHSNIKLPSHVRLKENKSGLSADHDNLQTIVFYLGQNTPPFIKELLEWRKATKFKNTYLKRFLKDADKDDFFAIHTNFNQDGTGTGRLSSSGPNLQNIPSRGVVGKEARKMFVPRNHVYYPSEEDNVLLVADLGQAELRMLAHYSQDPELLRAFEENRDLHILTGAGFARMQYEELKRLYDNDDPKAKELRSLGKTGNFALTYGMGGEKFQRYLLVNNNYEVELWQAKEWIKGYNEKYQIATEWKKGKFNSHTHKREGGVEQWILKHGYVVTFAGRKRRLPWAFDDDTGRRAYAVRQGINAVIQGSVGDVINEAMLYIQPQLERLEGTLLLQVHDELVAEVPRHNAEEARVMIEREMILHCNPRLRCPQTASCSIGMSWGEAKG